MSFQSSASPTRPRPSIFSLFAGGRAQFEGDTLAYDLILDGKCRSPPFKGTNVSVGISEDEFEEYVTFGH